MIRDKIIDYIRSGEKSEKDYAIGFEIENFIVDKDNRAVTYWDEGGIKDILEDLINIGYEAIYLDGVLLGAKKGRTAISLEPGSQFELSIKKAWKIKDLALTYTINNVFCLTNYSGYDPEVRSGSSVNNRILPGVDISAYPYARSHIFSLNFKY